MHSRNFDRAPRPGHCYRTPPPLLDLYNLSSGALHDDEMTRDFTWSIEDAQAVLTMTAALLGRVRAT